MSTYRSSDVTDLLLDWSRGDEEARDRLVPLVAEELRNLASRHLRREQAGHTLQPTALVNEAYLRLVELDRVSWQNRLQFFAFAARLMRHVLVDHARAQRAAKRGAGVTHVSLDEAIGAPAASADVDVLALHGALERLRELDETQSQVVELRFFGGLKLEEVVEVTGLSRITVSRRWASARAWLYRELQK